MHVERRAVRIYDRTTKDYVSITVQVEVDITSIAEQYAAKARDNRSKTAKQCHGAVVVRVKS